MLSGPHTYVVAILLVNFQRGSIQKIFEYQIISATLSLTAIAWRYHLLSHLSSSKQSLKALNFFAWQFTIFYLPYLLKRNLFLTHINKPIWVCYNNAVIEECWWFSSIWQIFKYTYIDSYLNVLYNFRIKCSIKRVGRSIPIRRFVFE